MGSVETVHLVYFSGTGGTARVARGLEQAFSRRGRQVRVTELDAQAYPRVDADLLVLAYPVYACNAPSPVDEWIARAPDGRGRAAAVVSVSGGGEVMPNTACRLDVIRKLERKGYRVDHEAMFVMPANFLLPYGDALSAMLLRAAPEKAEAFVRAVLSGERSRTKPRLPDRLMTRLCAAEKRGSKFFGKKLKANADCTGCGWCAGRCPRGNIVMGDGKPVFGDRCVICLRCVYGCPKRAIIPGRGGRFVLKEFDLGALEERTKDMTEFPPVSQAAKGRLFKGVRAYLEG